MLLLPTHMYVPESDILMSGMSRVPMSVRAWRKTHQVTHRRHGSFFTFKKLILKTKHVTYPPPSVPLKQHRCDNRDIVTSLANGHTEALHCRSQRQDRSCYCYLLANGFRLMISMTMCFVHKTAYKVVAICLQ